MLSLPSSLPFPAPETRGAGRTARTKGRDPRRPAGSDTAGGRAGETARFMRGAVSDGHGSDTGHGLYNERPRTRRMRGPEETERQPMGQYPPLAHDSLTVLGKNCPPNQHPVSSQPLEELPDEVPPEDVFPFVEPPPDVAPPDVVPPVEPDEPPEYDGV